MIASIRETVGNIPSNVRYAMQNPFGIDFEVHAKKVYIPLGSAINCLGYNDYLERAIGISRLAAGLFVIAKAESEKTRIVALAQIFRAVLEMVGNFERELLILDIAFTIFNLAKKVFPKLGEWTDLAVWFDSKPVPVPLKEDQLLQYPVFAS